MKDDRIRWNQKYRGDTWCADVSETVKAYHALAPGTRALDIACGTGGHAVYLADHGFIVEAVDISDAALTQIMPRHPRIRPVCADLDRFDLPRNRYDLILNIRYLNRRLFPQIREALTPGGVLIFETFLNAPTTPDGRQPHNREHLLRTNELLHGFLALEIILYREADGRCDQGAGPLATLVARRHRQAGSSVGRPNG